MRVPWGADQRESVRRKHQCHWRNGWCDDTHPARGTDRAQSHSIGGERGKRITTLCRIHRQIADQQGHRDIEDGDTRSGGKQDLHRLQHLGNGEHRPHLMQDHRRFARPQEVEVEIGLRSFEGQFDVSVSGKEAGDLGQRQPRRIEHIREIAMDGLAVPKLDQTDRVGGSIGAVLT